VRADARRNRARILEVAFAAFAAEGLSVPVHEIARRAGVGTGTVSRHFPTKEALFGAMIAARAALLMDRARTLGDEHARDPGAAFFAFFSIMVEELTADRGLADALAGAGIDLEATVAGSGQDVTGMLGEMLARAQRAGAVRPDADLADVKALMMGCLPAEPPYPAAGTSGRTGSASTDPPSPEADASEAARAARARHRRVEIVCAGLRAR
jgi:AcrR family transcriptional regulator